MQFFIITYYRNNLPIICFKITSLLYNSFFFFEFFRNIDHKKSLQAYLENLVELTNFGDKNCLILKKMRFS